MSQSWLTWSELAGGVFGVYHTFGGTFPSM